MANENKSWFKKSKSTDSSFSKDESVDFHDHVLRTSLSRDVYSRDKALLMSRITLSLSVMLLICTFVIFFTANQDYAYRYFVAYEDASMKELIPSMSPKQRP